MKKEKIKFEFPTPEEHNKKFWESYKPIPEWSDIELSCPKCGHRLKVNNYLVFASNPPQRQVRCPKCGYVGSIY